jgi:putative membrane-bound dehydrogenase-like protein
LRTVYDKLPEPPPRGSQGADKITILEDPDGDGRFDKAKDFVTGLNLASGMALGHGGVFVAQPPYLLFYPDRDRDDVPDSDPDVLLTGFGMEDAHAFVNSLQWGPDGWLYGAQGSTVTARIRGITFQQGIWRYHPLTKEFELFAEGGGNTWGVDFDRHGNLIAGTNFGGFAMLHQVQGAYYVKNFGKHGELQNPHAYGYFNHVPYQGFKGGHVTCGGIVYQGGALPRQYDNAYLAANLLSNALYWHHIERHGSSFTSRFGGDLLLANDPCFRPVDCLVGPDGALYIADWYDERAGHLDPRDNWDRSNGRLYKIEAKGASPSPAPSLSKLSSNQLVELLAHANDWYVREARRILAERRDPAVIPQLRRMLHEHRNQHALQTLWALYVSGGLDDGLAESSLGHPNEEVRAWTVRLLGDARRVSPTIQARLVQLARTESSSRVRSQLACTCKRLPASDALPIIRELLQRREDMDDPHIPLLIWWAIEDKAISHRNEVLALVDTPAAWRHPLTHKFILERLGRRYMAEGTDMALATCARLFAAAPGSAEIELLIRGMDKALEGRRLVNIPPALGQLVEALFTSEPTSLALTSFALRAGNAQACERALRSVGDPTAPSGDRIALIEVLAQVGKPECVSVLLRLLDKSQPKPIRLAALSALQSFHEPRIAQVVIERYPNLPADLRSRAQVVLSSRSDSALAFLRAVDRGEIPAKDVLLDTLQRILLHDDQQISRLVQKHWGKIGPATTGEKVALSNSIAAIIRKGPADPIRGRQLFQKHCATCHTLFGEGEKIGPELTGADRKNREALLLDIVDPNAVIRPEYVAQVVLTTDGRVLTGLIAESTPTTVTLLDAKNERTVIAREKIEAMRPSALSLMPERLLDPLDAQELRDLFAYLQGDGPEPPQVPRSSREKSMSRGGMERSERLSVLAPFGLTPASSR